MRKRLLALAATFPVALPGCDYNTFQTSDEQITASWVRANQGFRDLQASLKGTENRITVARDRPPKSTAGAAP